MPALLAFVNDAFTEMSQAGERADEFTYRDSLFSNQPVERRFPRTGARHWLADDPVRARPPLPPKSRASCGGNVRDRKTGIARPASPGDIAILFRSRASHREFEHELELLGIPTYVYKGLGFFDADETKDVVALVRYLARPVSDLRAAAFLRSRFVRLSDRGLATLSVALGAAFTVHASAAIALLETRIAASAQVRGQLGGWLRASCVPADLIEELLRETAYAHERAEEAAGGEPQEIRGMIRRIRTVVMRLPRIADTSTR